MNRRFAHSPPICVQERPMRMTLYGQTCNPPETGHQTDSRRRVLRVLALAPVWVPGLEAAADELQSI